MTTAEDVAAMVRSEVTGLTIPAHAEALRDAGAAFLSTAFRAFGSLDPGTRVARITRLENCPGGSTGQKLFLSVEYDPPAPHLHTDLFVKFSRDFSDPLRDRGRFEMASEVRFAALSRLAHFPVSVPKTYYADYHQDSGTGVLITQRIPFGVGEAGSGVAEGTVVDVGAGVLVGGMMIGSGVQVAGGACVATSATGVAAPGSAPPQATRARHSAASTARAGSER